MWSVDIRLRRASNANSATRWVVRAPGSSETPLSAAMSSSASSVRSPVRAVTLTDPSVSTADSRFTSGPRRAIVRRIPDDGVGRPRHPPA